VRRKQFIELQVERDAVFVCALLDEEDHRKVMMVVPVLMTDKLPAFGVVEKRPSKK
jgi:hypothetical protein